MTIHKETPIRKKVARTIAGFGAAMTSLYVAHDLQGDIIELHFIPDTIPVNSNYPQGVDIDELALGFLQWNDLIGKTLYAQSLTSVAVVHSGDVIRTTSFIGTFTIDFTVNQSSAAFVGFRSAGNVGWFQIDLGGAGNPIHYPRGQYGSNGEELVVGGKPILLGDVNCDGAVDLLDVQPFVDLLTQGGFLDKADMNQDQAVDLLDVQPFVDALTDP